MCLFPDLKGVTLFSKCLNGLVHEHRATLDFYFDKYTNTNPYLCVVCMAISIVFVKVMWVTFNFIPTYMIQ